MVSNLTTNVKQNNNLTTLKKWTVGLISDQRTVSTAVSSPTLESSSADSKPFPWYLRGHVSHVKHTNRHSNSTTALLLFSHWCNQTAPLPLFTLLTLSRWGLGVSPVQTFSVTFWNKPSARHSISFRFSSLLLIEIWSRSSKRSSQKTLWLQSKSELSTRSGQRKNFFSYYESLLCSVELLKIQNKNIVQCNPLLLLLAWNWKQSHRI